MTPIYSRQEGTRHVILVRAARTGRSESDYKKDRQEFAPQQMVDRY